MKRIDVAEITLKQPFIIRRLTEVRSESHRRRWGARSGAGNGWAIRDVQRVSSPNLALNITLIPTFVKSGCSLADNLTIR